MLSCAWLIVLEHDKVFSLSPSERMGSFQSARQEVTSVRTRRNESETSETRAHLHQDIKPILLGDITESARAR